MLAVGDETYASGDNGVLGVDGDAAYCFSVRFERFKQTQIVLGVVVGFLNHFEESQDAIVESAHDCAAVRIDLSS